jgi:Rad3-related DNA helicase/signal recognition particle subunit SEC65
MRSVPLEEETGKSKTGWKTRAKKRSIMEYFPYETPRPQQKELLLEIEKRWDDYDVFCVILPTAGGKSAILKTIAAWRASAAIIVPTNILVNQMAEAFPGMQKLQKRALYKCPRFGTGLNGAMTLSCEDAYKKYGGKKLGCSRECEYLKDNARARGRGYGVYNYYTYMANKLFKPTLLVDEAHGILKVLQDLGAQKIWRHDYKYPWDMWNSSDILNWVENMEETMGELPPVIAGLREEITSASPRYVIKRGRGALPEERELLTMLPVDTSDAPPVLWPGGKVQKIVLVSATISYKDIEGMGLGKRRTLYLESPSPIPAHLRRVYYDFAGAVNRANLRELTLEMCKKIEEIYLPKYAYAKGVIHATYAQAKIIKEHFGENPRFLFHTKEDTQQKLKEFYDSSPESGRVLVASGMYEGLDLVDDLARWQIIAKIPWLNLGDPAIKYKSGKDESWFVWETAKAFLQGCGRTTRRETDFSETIVLDKSVERLVDLMEKFNLMPDWFRDVLPNNET